MGSGVAHTVEEAGVGFFYYGDVGVGGETGHFSVAELVLGGTVVGGEDVEFVECALFGFECGFDGGGAVDPFGVVVGFGDVSAGAGGPVGGGRRGGEVEAGARAGERAMGEVLGAGGAGFGGVAYGTGF